MLPAAVSVIVILASGDPGDGSTRAIEQSLHSALGNDAVVTVRTTPPADVSDAALAATAASEHATLIGVVSWADRQRRVTIHFLAPPADRWTDREVRFDAADAPTERGRTVGFALASMVSDEALRANDSAHHDAATPAPIATVAPPATAGTPGTPSPPGARESDGPAPRPYATRMAFDASAVGMSGIGGYAGGFGGVLGFRVVLAGPVSLRLALGARVGEVAPAQATSRIYTGALGLAWQPWLDSDHRWSAGARIDALILRHELVHFSDDDAQPAHLARFMPGADAALEGSYRLADYASLIAASGAEIAFGETDVYLHRNQVASVAPVRLFLETGLRVTF
jgi:hypothetical protein